MPLIVYLLALVLAGMAVPDLRVGDAPAEAQTVPPSTCVACHTDAARLAALTAPDPPAEEQGEG